MRKKVLLTFCFAICFILPICWALPAYGRIVQTPPKCDTICFRSPLFFLLNPGLLPSGAVFIGGVNFNTPTSNPQAIRLALLGNAFGFDALTPLQLLNQQFVAAQLSIELAGGGGSPVAFNALWANLGCHGLFGNFSPVTLSNGFTITPNSVLKDIFMQAKLAILENRAKDMIVVAAFLISLHGNSLSGSCGFLASEPKCRQGCLENFFVEFDACGGDIKCNFAAAQRLTRCRLRTPPCLISPVIP